MNVGDKYRIKPSVGETVMAWWGAEPYAEVAGKVGEYIGINKNTKLPVIDFGPIMGPFNKTYDVAEEHLELVHDA